MWGNELELYSPLIDFKSANEPIKEQFPRKVAVKGQNRKKGSCFDVIINEEVVSVERKQSEKKLKTKS